MSKIPVVDHALAVVEDVTTHLQNEAIRRHAIGEVPPLQQLLELYRRRAVVAALAATGGNRTQAAKVLGTSRRSFLRMLAAAGPEAA
ncbi:MAG TPA: helix-turn-helix domain-containing protein [Xanthobacteraceae bacterium]|nr:helix-turn-helix domain-containing protein [Xanthobacteraceae bacterium]